jgi:hypothetical protein
MTLRCAAFVAGIAISTGAKTPGLLATTSLVRTVLNRIQSETTGFRDIMSFVDAGTFNNASGDDRTLDLVGEVQMSVDAVRTSVNSRQALDGNADFYIPDGTRVASRLRGTISTAASQSGDRFTTSFSGLL